MVPIIAVFLAANFMVALVSSEEYAAWSIRWRNRAYFAVTGNPKYFERIENADLSAAQVCRWLRPLLFTVVNLGVIAIAIYHFTNAK